MPQSLSRLHVHIVFSTKKREFLITDQVRSSLHAYMAKVLHNLGCEPVLINSVEDHVHVLVNLARTVAVSEALEEIKKTSSKWIKTQGPEFAGFAWQSGYAAFAVSRSDVAMIRTYIAQQRERHASESSQEEYRALLKLNEVAFDERYVWD